MSDQEEEQILMHRKSQTLVPLTIKYTPAPGSRAHIVSSDAFTSIGFPIEDVEDMDLRKNQVGSQKNRLDKEKGKIELNTSRYAILELEPAVIMAMVREVMEEAE